MLSGIYKIEHKSSGKCYVGSAVNVPRRLVTHRYLLNRNRHPNPHLQSAWNKYGADEFVFSLLAAYAPENLLVQEQLAIDSCGSKYNIAAVAGSQLGYRHTPEARAKMAAAKIGRKQSPELIAKRSAALMGHAVSERHRLSMSARLRGVPLSAEHRAKLSAAKRATHEQRKAAP